MARAWSFCIFYKSARTALQQYSCKGVVEAPGRGEAGGKEAVIYFLVADSSASALQFLHERNISHLDLKPQNILLSSLERPHLKLAGLEHQGGLEWGNSKLLAVLSQLPVPRASSVKSLVTDQ